MEVEKVEKENDDTREEPASDLQPPKLPDNVTEILSKYDVKAEKNEKDDEDCVDVPDVTFKELFSVNKKTRAQIVIELVALWNTVWNAIVYYMREFFPPSDGMMGVILAIVVGGIGNIVSVVVGNWKANAEVAVGYKKKYDRVNALEKKVKEVKKKRDDEIKFLESRLQEYQNVHLHDIALMTAYEAQVRLARGEKADIAKLMKRDLEKIKKNDDTNGDKRAVYEEVMKGSR